MSVASATPAQLAQLSNFVVLERSAIVQMWQLNKMINALTQAWDANILGNLFGILQTLQSTNFTSGNQAAFVLATGPDNIL